MLFIAGDVIPMSLGTGSPLVNEKEAGVFLAKGCKVPPNSVMRVGAQLSESMAGEYIVKATTKGELLIPRTLHNGGDNPVLCLINISDHYIEVEKGEVLAYAEEVCSNVETIGIQKVEVAEQGGPENEKKEIPEHLTNLFDKSKGELNEQEQTQLSELLCEFEDVFAKSEFDFSLTKGLPVPKLMGITSPAICSSFSLRCRDTPLASKKSKPSNISSSIGTT
jgi:hypothetical protein